MTKSLIALLVMSGAVFAQSVEDAWRNTPTSCDTACAQATFASVNNSGANNGWTLIYNGSTTGAISIPSGVSFVSVNGETLNPNSSFTRTVDAEVYKTNCGGSNPAATFTTSCEWGFTGTSVYGCSSTVATCSGGSLTAEQKIKAVWVYK